MIFRTLATQSTRQMNCKGFHLYSKERPRVRTEILQKANRYYSWRYGILESSMTICFRSTVPHRGCQQYLWKEPVICFKLHVRKTPQFHEFPCHGTTQQDFQRRLCRSQEGHSGTMRTSFRPPPTQRQLTSFMTGLTCVQIFYSPDMQGLY